MLMLISVEVKVEITLYFLHSAIQLYESLSHNRSRNAVVVKLCKPHSFLGDVWPDHKHVCINISAIISGHWKQWKVKTETGNGKLK